MGKLISFKDNSERSDQPYVIHATNKFLHIFMTVESVALFTVLVTHPLWIFIHSNSTLCEVWYSPKC